ncbi:MAG: flagellar export protein FliJ [Burkholderiaceae bacterium]|nr:flagellar export protein FliJ [Burkholderiaceae bacterium]
MPTLHALLQLLEHERRSRDEALQALSRSEGAAGQADAQAQALDTYRSEYVERWSARFREPGSVTLMQCYQGFIQRLDQAITQQRNTVAQARMRVDQARSVLQHNERRVASMEKLIERRQQQQQHQLARREQARTDETAQRAHARRMAAAHDHGESRL